jgi:hypothetical protein
VKRVYPGDQFDDHVLHAKRKCTAKNTADADQVFIVAFMPHEIYLGLQGSIVEILD